MNSCPRCGCDARRLRERRVLKTEQTFVWQRSKHDGSMFGFKMWRSPGDPWFFERRLTDRRKL
jgi:hypothetical protein